MAFEATILYLQRAAMGAAKHSALVLMKGSNMAKVTITLEDTIRDGKQVVMVSHNTDSRDVPDDSPMATDAMLHGLCIMRLWQSRALANMMPLVCADALEARAAVARKLAA
jgi:hypothetical protein